MRVTLALNGLTIARQPSCIIFEGVRNIVKEPVSFKKNKRRTSFQHLKIYNSDLKYLFSAMKDLSSSAK